MKDLGIAPSIRPHGDCILVRVEMKETSLILPEFVSSDDHLRYIVEAYGPGFYSNSQLIPLGVKHGDQLLLALSSLVPIWQCKVDEETGQPSFVDGSLFMVKVNSVLGVIEREAEPPKLRLSDNMADLVVEPR